MLENLTQFAGSFTALMGAVWLLHKAYMRLHNSINNETLRENTQLRKDLGDCQRDKAFLEGKTVGQEVERRKWNRRNGVVNEP